MKEVYILDAGALLSTWTTQKPSAIFFTTPEVVEELKNRPSKTRVETLSSLGRLAEESPSESAIETAKQASSEIGDKTSLSPTDLGIIALAYQKVGDGVSVTLVSTDLAVLNTAKHLGVRILDPSGRFRKKIAWVLVCPGCGHRSESQKGALECPICGTEMRRKRGRGRSK
jgi:rRNA maturation endonuclease Nob1